MSNQNEQINNNRNEENLINNSNQNIDNENENIDEENEEVEDEEVEDEEDESDDEKLYQNFLNYLADGDFEEEEDDDDDFNPDEVEDDEDDEDDDADDDGLVVEENIHDVLENYPYPYPPYNIQPASYPYNINSTAYNIEEDEEDDEDYYDNYYRERENAEDFRVREKEFRELIHDGLGAFSGAPIDLSYYQNQSINYAQQDPSQSYYSSYPPQNNYPPYSQPPPYPSSHFSHSNNFNNYPNPSQPQYPNNYNYYQYQDPSSFGQQSTQHNTQPYPSYSSNYYNQNYSTNQTYNEIINENSNSNLLHLDPNNDNLNQNITNNMGNNIFSILNPLYSTFNSNPSVPSSTTFSSSQTNSLCTDGIPINSIRYLLARQINLFLQLLYLMISSTSHGISDLFPMNVNLEEGKSREDSNNQTETDPRQNKLNELNKQLVQILKSWSSLRLSSIKKATFLKLQMRNLEEFNSISEPSLNSGIDTNNSQLNILRNEIRPYKRSKPNPTPAVSNNISQPSSSSSSSYTFSRPLTRSLLAENTQKFVSNSLFDHPLASETFYNFFKTNLNTVEENFKNSFSNERQNELNYLNYYSLTKSYLSTKMINFYRSLNNNNFYDSSIGPPLSISSIVFPTMTHPFHDLTKIKKEQIDTEQKLEIDEETKSNEENNNASLIQDQTYSYYFTPSQLDLFFRNLISFFLINKNIFKEKKITFSSLFNEKTIPLDILVKSLDPSLKVIQLKNFINRNIVKNDFNKFNRLLIIISDKWKVNDADRWSLVEELKIFRIFQNFTSFLVPGNLYGLFSQRQVEKLIGRWSNIQKCWMKAESLVYTEEEEGQIDNFDELNYDSDELMDDDEVEEKNKKALSKDQATLSMGVSSFLKDLLKCSKTSHFNEILKGNSGTLAYFLDSSLSSFTPYYNQAPTSSFSSSLFLASTNNEEDIEEDEID